MAGKTPSGWHALRETQVAGTLHKEVGIVTEPERSEKNTLRLVIAAGLLATLLAISAVLWGREALWLAGGLIIGVVAGAILLKRPVRRPGGKRPVNRPKQADKHYVLVVANQTLSGEALHREIVHRSSSLNTEVEIVCPAHNSAPGQGPSNEEEERKRVQRSLEKMTNQLQSAGVLARGRVGTDDPIATLKAAMRKFPADEVIISTHPYGSSNWLERDVVEYARNHFPVPITHVIVDLEHEKTDRQ